MRNRFRIVHRIASQFVDPIRAVRAVAGSPRFLADYRAYFRLPGAESRAAAELYPCLHERAPLHDFDAHYFYVNPWAARHIVAAAPSVHVDFASQTVLSTLLSAVIPVIFLDYRALPGAFTGMTSVRGDLLHLPVRDESLQSASCLHVAEHIGLGRYGDRLDPEGTKKATQELIRVLAPGASLLFALPVGRQRVVFNAHRIHAAETIREYFAPLDLEEFSGVTDEGRFLSRVPLGRFRDSDYACGFFRFVKPRV